MTTSTAMSTSRRGLVSKSCDEANVKLFTRGVSVITESKQFLKYYVLLKFHRDADTLSPGGLTSLFFY